MYFPACQTIPFKSASAAESTITSKPLCIKTYVTHALFFSFCQICDKEWHYYVINVEFPVVMLYVDGVTYDPYLVTDDWPIHPSQIDVQLTVGACWQGEWPEMSFNNDD